jgi:hypothetical protein
MAKPAKKGAKAQSKKSLPAHASNKVTVKIPTGKRTSDDKVEKRDEVVTAHANGTMKLDDAVTNILNQLAVTFTVDEETGEDIIKLNTDSNYAMMKVLTRSGDHFTEKSQVTRALDIITKALNCYKSKGMPMHGKDNGAVGAVAKATAGAGKEYSTTSRFGA